MSRPTGGVMGKRKIPMLTKSVLLILANERGGDLEDCTITDLDFSGDQFELESLDGLEAVNWKQIKAIDASNNALDRIDSVLNKFTTIETIVASNNLITIVNIALPNLLELDLSRNYLKEMPDLSRLPRLEKLLLGYNEISTGYDQLEFASNLMLLDLSNNKFNFPPGEFKRFLDILIPLKRLNTIRILGNPFCQIISQYEYYFVYHLSALNSLNNEIIREDLKKDLKKKKLRPLEDLQKEVREKAKKALVEGTDDLIDASEMPRLEDLHINLQFAKTRPTECFNYFKKVKDAVELIINRPKERFVIFKANTPEEHNNIRVAIDSFLQEAVMMIEDMPTMRSNILRLLANLTEVSEGAFGQKCLMILQDLLDSGPEIAKEIEKILEQVIIPKLNRKRIEDVPRDVLIGILKLTEAQEVQSMLSSLVDTMEDWVHDEVLLEEHRLVAGVMPDDNIDRELHSYALALVAANANDEENAEKMTERNIADYTSRLIKVMERETEPSALLSGQVEGQRENMDRLRNVLKIVEHMSKNNKRAANIFISEELHQKILRDIWEYLMFYKANGYTFSVGGSSTEEKEKEYYKLMTAYLSALTGLCHSKTCVEYLNTTAATIRDEILAVAVMPRTDPVLMTAILELVEKVLSKKHLQTDEYADVFRHYSSSLQKMLPFLPYLGGKKYKDICILGEKYSKGTMAGQDPIQPSGLTNRVLHKLFISIINLIKFFSGKAVEISPHTQIVEICKNISNALNNNNREEHLFHCLEIPNDDVKLAVVRCLDKVPLDEIDMEEIGYIVRVLADCKNLGVGRTEEVLAQIFLLLTKMAKEVEKGQEFRSKFGEMVISECYNILEKNSNRDLRDNLQENEEKMYLTMSCVLFLKESSAYNSLKLHLSTINTENKLRNILKAEERFSVEKSVPVDIERTYTGKNVDCLLRCFTGYEHLMPYHTVSVRTMMRMADVLMGIPDEKPPDPWSLKGELLEELSKVMKEQNRKRLRKEASTWAEYENHIDENFDFTLKQQKKFCDSRGIETVLNFLMGKSSVQTLEIERALNQEYNSAYRSQTLLQRMMKTIEETNKEYDEHKREYEEADKKELTKKDVLDDSMMEDEDLLEQAMQAQPIGSRNAESWEDPEGFFLHDLDTLRRKELKSRGYILAAFLRCIFALLEYGSDSSRMDTISQLKNPTTLKNLTMLCATTGWKYSTIGAKYLRVVKHIIRISPIHNFRIQEDVILLEPIAYAMNEILQIMNKRLRNREREPLTAEDLFLMSELAGIGAHLCSTVNYFAWSDKIDTIYVEKTSQVIKSVQDRVASELLMNLLPVGNVRYFIEILYFDMTGSERMKPDSYKRDKKELEMMDKTRDFIGDLLGNYIATCGEDAKYRVLEFCKLGVIFENQILNNSYLQDVLNRSKSVLYSIELSRYMRKNYGAFKLPQDKVPERIVLAIWGDLVMKGSSSLKKRLLVITPRCIYILAPPGAAPCPLCGEERFCPTGPTLDFNIQYMNIMNVISFKNLPQIMGLRYSDQGRFGTKSNSFVFITSRYRQGEDLIDCIREILAEIRESDTKDVDNPEAGLYNPVMNDMCLVTTIESFLNEADYGNMQKGVYCSVNPKGGLPVITTPRAFPGGYLCVVTDKNMLVVLDLVFRYWELVAQNDESVFLEGNAIRTRLLSVYKVFDLSNAEEAMIPPSGECKIRLNIGGSDNWFVFGDDLGLEVFQRYVVGQIVKSVGGHKVGRSKKMK